MRFRLAKQSLGKAGGWLSTLYANSIYSLVDCNASCY